MLLVSRNSFLSALASVCACITCLFFLIYFVLTLIIFILNSQFGDSYIHTVPESRSDDFCLYTLSALLVGLSWLLLRTGHSIPGDSRDGEWYFVLSWQAWTVCIFSISGCFIFICTQTPQQHLSMKSSIPPSFLWRISWLFLINTVPSLVNARTISLFFLTWGCEVISASRISAPVPRAANEAWRPVDPKFPQWPPQVYKITIERTLPITELETSGAILDGALD